MSTSKYPLVISPPYPTSHPSPNHPNSRLLSEEQTTDKAPCCVITSIPLFSSLHVQIFSSASCASIHHVTAPKIKRSLTDENVALGRPHTEFLLSRHRNKRCDIKVTPNLPFSLHKWHWLKWLNASPFYRTWETCLKTWSAGQSTKNGPIRVPPQVFMRVLSGATRPPAPHSFSFFIPAC